MNFFATYPSIAVAQVVSTWAKGKGTPIENKGPRLLSPDQVGGEGRSGTESHRYILKGSIGEGRVPVGFQLKGQGAALTYPTFCSCGIERLR